MLTAGSIDTNKLLKKENKMPRTRRELLTYLWFGRKMNINLFREGQQYIIQKGNVLIATQIFSINSLSFFEWYNFINKA